MPVSLPHGPPDSAPSFAENHYNCRQFLNGAVKYRFEGPGSTGGRPYFSGLPAVLVSVLVPRTSMSFSPYFKVLVHRNSRRSLEQPVFFHPIADLIAVQSQERGGAGLIAVRAFEREGHQPPLHVVEVEA